MSLPRPFCTIPKQVWRKILAITSFPTNAVPVPNLESFLWIYTKTNLQLICISSSRKGNVAMICRYRPQILFSMVFFKTKWFQSQSCLIPKLPQWHQISVKFKYVSNETKTVAMEPKTPQSGTQTFLLQLDLMDAYKLHKMIQGMFTETPLTSWSICSMLQLVAFIMTLIQGSRRG